MPQPEMGIPSGIERKLGKQERVGAADRRELDADERAVGPGTHVGLYISGTTRARCSRADALQAPAYEPTCALDLKRKPVGDDLRACVSIERRQRTVDR